MFKGLKQTVSRKTFDAPPDAPRIEVRRRTPPGEETPPQTCSRDSNGLRHFLTQLPGVEGNRILDLGGLIDSNARYWAEKGVRVHAIDLLRTFDNERARMPQSRFDDRTARRFVEEYLPFHAGMFDGILVWDVLHFLDIELLRYTIAKLTSAVRTGGVVLCFFHNRPKGERVPICRYAMNPDGKLEATVRWQRAIPTTFTNRNLEALFQDFRMAQFFLSRDNLREVIAVR